MNRFFPDAIRSWNNAISHFQNVPSLGTFKKHITSLIRQEKQIIFGIHDHSGVGYLFQLRVGLCSLRYHKKRHNFVDTPSDECLNTCSRNKQNCGRKVEMLVANFLAFVDLYLECDAFLI